MINKKHLLLLALLVFIAYVNSLPNGFVSDDREIVNDAAGWNFSNLFLVRVNFFRLYLYLILYKLAGLTPIVFRLTNIFFHVGVTWMVYTLVKMLSKQRVALIAAALFAVHPILVESVAWISGGAYPQYTFFSLLSLITYIISPRSTRFFFVSLLSFLLALISSEKAIVTVAIIFLYELPLGNIRLHWRQLVPYVMISVLFVVWYVTKIGFRTEAVQSAFYQSPGGFSNPFVQIPTALTTYLSLIFWPDVLTLYHVDPKMQPVTFFIFVLLLVYFWKRNKLLFFFLSLFPLSLLPTLTPFRIGWPVAERYVYMGTIGLTTIAAYLLNKKRKLFFLFFIILILLTGRTITRNLDWKNEETLFVAANKVNPNLPNVHLFLGVTYGQQGKYEESIAHLTKLVTLMPNYAEGYFNLGLSYQRSGQYPQAIKNYQKALLLNPNLQQASRNLEKLLVY